MPDLVFATKGTAEVIRQQTLVNERAAELSSIYKADANAALELERAAQRVFKNAQNPAKQFNEEMGKLLGHYKQGKINAEQYEKGVKKLTTAYEDTQTIGGKLQRQLQSLFGSKAAQQLGAFVTGVGSVTAAVATLKSEYQATLDLIEKASQTQLDVGQSRNLVIRNMPGATPKQINSVIEKSYALSGRLNLPETVVNQALANSLPGAGGNVDVALGAVRKAGQYLPDQPGDIPQFAGALIDMSKVTGTTNQDVNLGYLIALQRNARNFDAGSLARNAPKGLIGATRYGATPQEAAALFQTLGIYTGDVEGAATSTALVQLASQLSLKEIGSEAGAKTTGQRLAFLQQNPEAAKAFLAKASFEAQSKGQIRDLILNPQGEIAKSFAANLGQIPGQKGLANLGNQALLAFQANELEPLAAAERSLKSFNEKRRVNATQNLTQEGVAQLKEALVRVAGTSNLGAGARNLLGQLEDGELGISIPEASSILKREAKRLRQPTYGGATEGSEGVEIAPSKADLKSSKELEELAEILKQSLDQQKETNRKLGSGGMIVGNR